MTDAPTCLLCGGSPARLFQVVIDGEPLHLQPRLCAEHGDDYVLRVGYTLGELMAGRPHPAGFVEQCAENAARIYVRDQLDGKWGSYSLAELPAAVALAHVARWMREQRTPVVVMEPPPF